MALHRLVHEPSRSWPSPRASCRNALVQLGWPQFWLLASTLGGMLALIALAFFISLVTH